MKTSAKYIAVILLIIASITIVICFPQLYYFDNKLTYKNFNLYSDKPFSEKTYLILDKVDALIHKSEIYDPRLRFKIFIRSNYSVHNTLPWQYSNSAYATTRPLVQNIFISKGNFQSNLAYKISGGTRPLDEVIAHEIIHVLIANRFINDRAKFPDDWTKAGFLWKEEGYAEYIAGSPSLDLKKGLSILKGRSDIKYNIYELEYFKYWLAVKYLLETKKITIRELIESKISLDNILGEAVNAANRSVNKGHRN